MSVTLFDLLPKPLLWYVKQPPLAIFAHRSYLLKVFVTLFGVTFLIAWGILRAQFDVSKITSTIVATTVLVISIISLTQRRIRMIHVADCILPHVLGDHLRNILPADNSNISLTRYRMQVDVPQPQPQSQPMMGDNKRPQQLKAIHVSGVQTLIVEFPYGFVSKYVYSASSSGGRHVMLSEFR